MRDELIAGNCGLLKAAGNIEAARAKGIAEHLAGWEHLTVRQAAARIQADAATIAGQAEQIAVLEGERGRLREALEPSGDTKAAYSGEFSITITEEQEDEDGEDIEVSVKWPVPWTTTKEIMAAIRARAALATSKGGKHG